MLAPRCVFSSRGFKGISNIKPITIPKVINPTRHYSNKNPTQLLDEWRNEADSLLADIKANPPKGIDMRAAQQKQSAELVSHYKEFYNSFAGPGASVVSEKPPEFFKLPEREQKIHRDLDKDLNATYLKHLEKGTEDLLPGIARLNAIFEVKDMKTTEPVTVCITGAAGAIGYALAYRIASGGLFGPKTPVILNLLELPQALKALKGVEMELLDCAFPTLKKVVITDSPDQAFEGVDYALLVGAQPRTKGMERGDLLLKNAEIFKIQGRALNTAAKGADTRVVVVGNPANTNALIASHYAPSIPRTNFIAMTRLDHNRALAQIAQKTNAPLSAISRVIIWGNHSATQFPDLSHAWIGDNLALDVIKDDKWYKTTFIPAVQQRGAAIINARGASSAASAGSSALDTVFDWHFGTNTEWMSAAVHSEGEYGVTPGLFYSYPVVFNDRKEFDVVKNLPLDAFSAEMMETTHKELLSERDAVSKLLAN